MEVENKEYNTIEELEAIGEDIVKSLRRKNGDALKGIKDALTKLYTQSGHFVFELIQNAEDCDATEVSFNLLPDKLIFTHNGTKLFRLEDVDSITNVGNSTKTDNGNSIGKFGVGFKSVFEYTNTPEIHSGNFHFLIKDLFIPHSIKTAETESFDKTIFSLPFDVADKTPEDCFNQIQKTLTYLPAETLLFLRHIKRISIKYSEKETLIERKENNAALAPKNLCALTKNNSVSSHYVRYFDKARVTERYNENQEENIEKEIEIGLAFKAEFSDKNGWSIKPILNAENPSGKVFTFFPCEAEHSGLCFHIHAPFALTVDREKLRYEPANAEIKEKLAGLLADSLESIKESNLLNMDFLKTLPNEDDALGSYEVFKNIKEKFNCEPFTPMENGTFAPAKGKLRSQRQISSLFDDSDMNKLFGTNGVAYWIKNPRQQNQRDDKFIQGLGCKNFHIGDFIKKYVEIKNNYDDILRFLQNVNAVLLDAQKQKIQYFRNIETIFENKNPSWYTKFYKLLHIGVENYDIPYYIKDDVKSFPLCLCSSNKLHRFEDCYLPSENESLKTENVNIIHPSICEEINKNLELSLFFLQLGVRKYSKSEIFKQNFEKFLSGSKSTVEFINIFHSYLELEDKNSIFNYFKNFASHKFLKTESNTFENGENIFITESYMVNPTIRNISAYYTDKNIVRNLEVLPLTSEYLKFLKDDYEKNSFVDFLRKFGGKTDIPIIKCSCHKNPIFWEVIRKEAEGYTHGNSNPTDIDFTIPFLESVMKTPTIEKFELIWSKLLSTPLRMHIDYMNRDISCCYYCNAQKYAEKSYPSQLIYILKNSEWVAQNENDKIQFVKPKDAVRSKLPDYKYWNSQYNSTYLEQWLSKLDFGKAEKEQQAEYQKKLEEERQCKENLEKISTGLGFSSDFLSELEQARKEGLIDDKSFLDYINEKRRIKSEQSEVFERNSELPVNETHFKEKIRENYENSENIESEKRERTVRTSNSGIKESAKIKLRDRYTNPLSGTMLCQLCKKPMPFKDKQDSDYFETRQLFSSELFEKESDENYVALCPICTAKYKVYMSKDTEKQKELWNSIKQNGNEITEFALSLDYDYELHFDKKHILALLPFLGVEDTVTEKKKVVIVIKPKKIEAFCINCKSTFFFPKDKPIVSCDKCHASYQNRNGVITKMLTKTNSVSCKNIEISFDQLKKSIEMTRKEKNGYVLVALLAKSLESVLGYKPKNKMRIIVNSYLEKLSVSETPAFSVKIKE